MNKLPASPPPRQIPGPGRIVHYTAEGYAPGERVTHAAMIIGTSHLPGRVYLDTFRGVYPVPGERPNIVEAVRLPEHDDGIPYSEYPRVGYWHWPSRTTP